MQGKPISPDDQRGFYRRLMATLEELGAVYDIAHNQAQTVVLGVNQLTTGCSACWNASRENRSSRPNASG